MLIGRSWMASRSGTMITANLRERYAIMWCFILQNINMIVASSCRMCVSSIKFTDTETLGERWEILRDHSEDS